ncbi:thiopeptide-type bacteriocin biosynthesis protein [Nonomuraea sp. NPDC050643]|uniref:thiopeptide-type bacteriocin biosynthesis protein n=1 Tax=Nonomuraea sp. NPDC050643 TaxID=3155660 RepID=UPI0033EFDE3E
MWATKITESEVLPPGAMAAPAEPWVQFGIQAPPERRGDLYRNLDTLARQAIGTGLAHDFFYMHKHPGLRIRFRADEGGVGRLNLLLREHLHDWQREGLVGEWRPGMYEPETYLFGGPASMRSVHRVFTADSLAWLGFHHRNLATGNGREGRPGPAWAMSLLMLQTLFEALRIVDWEDLDVWDRVRRFRSLAPAAVEDPRLAQLGTVLRGAWPSRSALAAKVSPEAAELAEEYRAAVLDEGKRWIREYFESGSAGMGPRAVASYMVIFHWNRAGLPAVRQALITHALLVRAAGDAR